MIDIFLSLIIRYWVPTPGLSVSATGRCKGEQRIVTVHGRDVIGTSPDDPAASVSVRDSLATFAA